MARKPLSPRERFEVFKRDQFTCQYCGRKTPEVVLEVDHVIPVSSGGLNDIKNLVTSCWECNRGKGARLLGDSAPVSDIHDQTITMLERELQLREYNAVATLRRQREDAQIDHLLDFWDFVAPYKRDIQYPDKSTLRSFLQVIPMEDIKDAMEIACDRMGATHKGVSYLVGILKNKRADASREEAYR